MKKRLLLDGVALNAAHIAKRHPQLPTFVETHAADSLSAGAEQAAVAASDTAQPVSLTSPKRPNRGVASKKFAERFGPVGRV